MQPDDSLGKSSVVADPLTEGIHKDTDGPDKASDRVQYVAHLPGRYLALADVCASSFRLGHGPHLLPKPSLPGKDTWTFREEVPKGGKLHHASRHRHPERGSTTVVGRDSHYGDNKR